MTLCAGAASLGTDWGPVGRAAGLQLSGATACLILGDILSVMSIRRGEIGFVAPFRHTGLVWAPGPGFFAFGDRPDPLTLARALPVAATGIFTLPREGRLARAARSGPPRA